MTLDEVMAKAMAAVAKLVADKRREFFDDLQRAGTPTSDEMMREIEAREPEMLAELEKQIRDQRIGMSNLDLMHRPPPTDAMN